MKKLIIIILVLTIGLVGCGNSKIKFEDPEFEKLIKEATGLEVITLNDAMALKTLDLKGKEYYKLNGKTPNITSIKGIEKFENLEELNLSYCQPEDYSPLEKLTKLRSLDLSGAVDFKSNYEINSSVISKLKNLEVLNMYSCDLEDISFIKDLEKLEDLTLQIITSDTVVDGSIFDKLVNLKKLTIHDSSFNIVDMPELLKLESITMYYSKIENLDFLKNSVNLKTLVINGGEIESLESIKGLTKLEVVDLSRNNITDISPIREMVNIKDLNLSFNQISNIDSLGLLVNLSKMDLSLNLIKDISILKSLPNLKTILITNNEISDISPLLSLENLKIAKLSDNPYKDDETINKLKNKGCKVVK